MAAGSRVSAYVAGILLVPIMLVTVAAAGAPSPVAASISEEDPESTSSDDRGPTRPSWPAEAATIPDPTETGGHVTPRMAALYDALRTLRMVHSASCWDPHVWNPNSDHPKGRACDLFHNHRDPADVDFGWRVANWLTTNYAIFGIRYVIWQGQIWHARRLAWNPYRSRIYDCPNPANVTGCHYDHIHISVF